MKLLKLSYITSDWELKDLELNSVNLIVAKNATGKSRTLLSIDLLIKTITQKKDLERIANWDVEFQNNSGNILNYKFTTAFNDAQYIITDETLFIDNTIVLFRDNKITKIKNMLTNTDDIVDPPNNKLTLHTNRDVKKYPYLEEIANWAKNSHGSKFGNISPLSKLNSKSFSKLVSDVEDDVPVLFKALNDESKNNVISQFNAAGYNTAEITVKGNEDIVLYVKEIGVQRSIPHYQLAQGMYRTLSLIVFLEFLSQNKRPDMFIIDDLCEGLDYERAKKLGGLIFKRCLDSGIQLVATSNDIFLMEIVDIKYWNILMRKGKVVTALNYKNNPKIFDDFRFTGLSNFDFFSSDFLNQELAP